jgi:NAD-dependent SIR2 family protein deacetylase
MLVAGTSTTVYPAAWFPVQVQEKGGHLIAVNLYESELTPLCTVSLHGKCGEILPQLMQAVHELRARH